jgi:hypothetical protein
VFVFGICHFEFWRALVWNPFILYSFFFCHHSHRTPTNISVYCAMSITIGSVNECGHQHFKSRPEGHNSKYPWLVQHICLNCYYFWFSCNGSCSDRGHGDRRFSFVYPTMKHVRRHHVKSHISDYGDLSTHDTIDTESHNSSPPIDPCSFMVVDDGSLCPPSCCSPSTNTDTCVLFLGVYARTPKITLSVPV